MPDAKRVVWAPAARQDLLDVWLYYSRVASPEIADNILRGIQRAIEAIPRSPLARQSRDELMPGLRSALASPHTIFFRIQNDEIQIIRVAHGRRDFQGLFGRHDDGDGQGGK